MFSTNTSKICCSFAKNIILANKQLLTHFLNSNNAFQIQLESNIRRVLSLKKYATHMRPKMRCDARTKMRSRCASAYQNKICMRTPK